MTTFSGKLLRIDLTHSTSRVEEIPRQYHREYISARGLAAKYLYDELSPMTDALDADNRLILSIGVLGGTGLQGFSKWAVTTKSPLTGTITRSFAGGNFGVWMKFAGFDMIIVQGRAPRLTYVYIDAESGVAFLDAGHLSGIDPRSLQKELKSIHGPKTESACIGVAGEKLVRYAVITAGERTASRGGVGTVMGSKNLKAVAINVSVKKPVPSDPDRFRDLVKAQIDMLREHPRKKAMTTLGTPYITTPLMEGGILPVRNFRKGSIARIQEINGREFLKIKKQKAGCYGCMTRCGGMRDVASGPLKGSRIDGPEYETIFSFGPLIGVHDRQFIVDANAACDYYGIDTISAGVCLAFACDLSERGMLSPAQTDGLDLSWGNKAALFTLLEKIGLREGFGAILAEGVKRAADHIGGEAPSCAMHIKGLELPGYEPRAVKGYALSMATANIGGSHMYGRPRPELSGKTDPFTETNKGAAIAKVQKEQAVEDALVACTFGNSGLTPVDYANFLTAATGIEFFADPDHLMMIGERIICVERCFNVREGFGREEDTLPERMRTEPLQDAGPATNQIVKDLDGLLDEYYDSLGYTPAGVPTTDKLKELNIDLPQLPD
jgi:aldehyde:ferredoxin oxidoreductase